MSAIFKPLSAKDLLKPAGQCGIQLLNSSAITPFGHATLTFKKSSTKSEVRTPEDPGRPIVATDYSELTGMVDIEFGNLNTLGLALAFMAKVKPYSQPLVAARTDVFTGVSLNQWLELKDTLAADAQGLISTVVTAVKIDNAALIQDRHYKHDPKSGIVQIIAWPDDVTDGADVSITFSAPAVVAAPSRSSALLLQELVVRGRLILRQNNLRGVNRKLIIPQIAFGGDSGDVQLIQDGNDIVKITASGTIEADYTQKPGYESGYTVDL